MTLPPKTRERLPWTLVVLLVFAMAISFFDRGNLAVAAPVLAPELGLSTWSVGLLLSAFFWTYAISQIGAGWLVDRVEVRWVYAAGFLVWSIATLGTGFVGSFGGLLTMRLLLGIGESVTYPASSRILAAVIPERRRGLANSLVDLGARLGPATGTMCGALLVAKLGWRGLFLITGGVALVWLIPWLIAAPRVLAAPPVQLSHPVAGPSWGELMRRRSFWGTCGGLCGANYAWYFLLSWLPSYLVRERHFTLAFGCAVGRAAVSLHGGILHGRRGSGGPLDLAGRAAGAGAESLPGDWARPDIGPPAVGLASPGGMGSRRSLRGMPTFGIYASNLFSLTQTLAGPEAAGRWTGFQNACGNLAGIVSPMLTGWLVSRTGGFAAAFLAASFACLVGAASFALLVREQERIAPRPQKTFAKASI